MTLPYVLLGSYKPTKWRAWKIGRDLTSMTKEWGLKPHASEPMLKIMEKSSWKDYKLHANVCRFAHPEYEGSSWHQDGDHAPGADMRCALVLWASRNPTEIKGSDDKVYQPEPYEI